MQSFVVLAFGSEKQAYEALAGLDQLHHAGVVSCSEASIVERSAGAGFVVRDGVSFGPEGGGGRGTLARILVDLLRGPLGVLMGFIDGAPRGPCTDPSRQTLTGSALHRIVEHLGRGRFGLFATVEEWTTDGVDGVGAELGGQLLRLPADVLQLALENAITADKAMRAAARVALRAERREQRASSWVSFTHALCDKLRLEGATPAAAAGGDRRASADTAPDPLRSNV